MLAKARLRMLRGELKRAGEPEITDFRGPIRRNSQKCQTPLAPDKAAELVAQYVAGESVKTLAERFGIPRQTVCHYAKPQPGVLGLPQPRRKDGLTRDGRDSARSSRMKGDFVGRNRRACRVCRRDCIGRLAPQP